MLDNCIVFPIENRHVIFLNINVVTIIIIITIVICVVPILVNMTTSFFDEKSGIVPCNTEWGRWWQTVEELHIEVMLPANTKAKDVGVHITNSNVTCRILGKTLFSGNLFRKVHADETVWTIEDGGTLLNIVLAKADFVKKEIVWESLMEDGTFKADPITYHEMRKKMDLEKFQIEYPGMDFSKAQLQKNYDTIPGLNNTSEST